MRLCYAGNRPGTGIGDMFRPSRPVLTHRPVAVRPSVPWGSNLHSSRSMSHAAMVNNDVQFPKLHIHKLEEIGVCAGLQRMQST